MRESERDNNLLPTGSSVRPPGSRRPEGVCAGMPQFV